MGPLETVCVMLTKLRDNSCKNDKIVLPLLHPCALQFCCALHSLAFVFCSFTHTHPFLFLSTVLHCRKARYLVGRRMVLNHTVIYRNMMCNSKANNSHTSTVILGLLGHISLSEICQIGPLPAQLMSKVSTAGVFFPSRENGTRGIVFRSPLREILMRVHFWPIIRSRAILCYLEGNPSRNRVPTHIVTATLDKQLLTVCDISPKSGNDRTILISN